MPPQCFGINSVIFIFAIRGSRRQEMQAAAALGRLSGHDHDSTEKKKNYSEIFACSGFCAQ